MKKEIKKLSLGKKTISNLKPSEMRKLVGAGHGGGYGGHNGDPQKTKNGNTCPGHATCV